jgi:hypothetical protein
MTAALAILLAGCGNHVSIPPMRPASPPAVEHSVRIDFGQVVNERTDWKRIAAWLDAVHVSTVDLDAGRVEFTAFDWSGHEDAAADPGTDHVAVAADAVHASADGQQRQVNLVVDALVPKWIKSDPSIAGVDVQGRRSEYIAFGLSAARRSGRRSAGGVCRGARRALRPKPGEDHRADVRWLYLRRR